VSNKSIALVCVTIALCGSSLSQSGFWVNFIDISPKYAGKYNTFSLTLSGHLMGLSNTFASIPGIVGNVLTGVILDATHSWTLVFSLLIVMYVSATIFFSIFASGEVQFE